MYTLISQLFKKKFSMRKQRRGRKRKYDIQDLTAIKNTGVLSLIIHGLVIVEIN